MYKAIGRWETCTPGCKDAVLTLSRQVLTPGLYVLKERCVAPYSGEGARWESNPP